MGVIARSLGSLLTGIVLGGIKAIRGNAPVVAESAVFMGLASVIDYFAPDDNPLTDVLRGVESASSAVLATDLADMMQVAKQVWRPTQEDVYLG